MIGRRFMFAGALVATTGAAFVGVAVAGSGDQPGFAALSGANEIGGGDPDGHGSATFSIDDGQLCFGLTVANIEAPIGAHIHAGKQNENGPVVVGLTPPTSGDPGTSSGCVDVSPEVAAAIQKHPNHYYVNVHTGDFPAGAVRGQVFLRHA